MKRVYIRTVEVNAPAAVLFRWHEMPGVFQRLSPPFENVRLVRHSGTITDGSTANIRIRQGPFSHNCVFEHYDYQPGQRFCDKQVKGPFQSWTHTHRCIPDGQGRSILEDSIVYELPASFVSDLAVGDLVNRKLDAVFGYRHQVTRNDVERFHNERGASRMRILVSGASGLVGGALTNFLTSQGHQVVRLVRRSASTPETVQWDPSRGSLDSSSLEGVDVVIHLAGESVAQRWTDEVKSKIKESRISGTKLLADALSRMKRKPRALVCASAIGFYGDRGTESLTEESLPGTGFLAGVCREWEDATASAAAAGIRTVNLRFGVILSTAGGALAKMLPIFQLGAGGNLGSGRQYMSWITLEDAVQSIYFAAQTEGLSGPVNIVAPQACTNAEFTATLGKVLHRPTLLPVPQFGPRLIFGEMADEMLFAGAKVLPSKLEKHGFRFQYPELETALRHELGR